jgi:bacteriocin-like protein
MKSFGLDKNYEQINFEEVTVEELQAISGGSGGLTLMEGGLIIVGLAGAPTVGVGLAAFAIGLGVTMIIGSVFGQYG